MYIILRIFIKKRELRENLYNTKICTVTVCGEMCSFVENWLKLGWSIIKPT